MIKIACESSNIALALMQHTLGFLCVRAGFGDIKKKYRSHTSLLPGNILTSQETGAQTM